MIYTDFDRMKTMLGERYPVWLAAHARSLNRKIVKYEYGTREEKQKRALIKKTLKVVEKELKQMGALAAA